MKHAKENCNGQFIPLQSIHIVTGEHNLGVAITKTIVVELVCNVCLMTLQTNAGKN